MTLTDTIDTTFSDLARTIDHNAELWAERTSPPVDAVIRRLGAINSEAVRQVGMVSLTTIDAVRGLVTVAWTGVSDVAIAAVDAADESASDLRSTGRRVAGDLKQATSTIRNRAGKAIDDVERNLSAVGRKAGTATARVKDEASDAFDEVVKADDTAVSEVAGAGASTPSGSYENWTKEELYDRAQQLDIDGRSGMNKTQLIRALRSA